MKEKILVTGGTGYIGSHTVVSLFEEVYDVVIVDNLINSSKSTLDGIESITGKRPQFSEVDLCKKKDLDKFISENKDIAAVIHFAALKAVGESVQKPIQYYKNNLLGLINLIQCMQENNINNLVFSSSATVYGEPDFLPITEDHPSKRGMSPYGNTKKVGEEIIEDTVRAEKNFKAVSLRYFNPIGAHDSGKLGELPAGIPHNLMPYITQTAIGKRKELIVFGDDYNTPDGTPIRDYLHVVDLAEAHVKTVDRLLQNKNKSKFEVFNLGTGQGNSVFEVIRSFEKASGNKLPYKVVDRRDGDVETTYAATDKASQELKWKAKHSLDDMTSSAWKWEQHVMKKNNK